MLPVHRKQGRSYSLLVKVTDLGPLVTYWTVPAAGIDLYIKRDRHPVCLSPLCLDYEHFQFGPESAGFLADLWEAVNSGLIL